MPPVMVRLPSQSIALMPAMKGVLGVSRRSVKAVTAIAVPEIGTGRLLFSNWNVAGNGLGLARRVQLI